ncbi:hypothetical protein LINPERPRIM_LOCUS26269 [Linum perenne]
MLYTCTLRGLFLLGRRRQSPRRR